MIARRLAEARLALMLLTRLPAGHLPEPAPDLADARWAFPFIGLLTGALGFAVFSGARALGLSAELAAVLAFGALALLSGGLHLDGLADFADGFGGRDRARRLEIMRDSRIGSYGVIALIGVSAAQLLAMAQAAGQMAGQGAGLALFLLAGVLSRLAMLALLVALPPARADGMGRLAAGRVLGPGAGRVLGPGAALAGGLMLATGAAALPVLAAGAVAAGAVSASARARLGGQTGDVLGAAQILSETAIWLAFAAQAG